MAKIIIDDKEVIEGLADLVDRIDDPTPAWSAAGELLIASTRRRFAESKGPDGATWLANRPSTVENFLRKRSGTRTSRGRVSAKGSRLAGSKKPLIGDSRQLSKQILKRASKDGLVIGSSRKYAATQQFGAKRGAYRSGARPIPWGDIPARPFLGLSDSDRVAVIDAFLDYLDASK